MPKILDTIVNILTFTLDLYGNKFNCCFYKAEFDANYLHKTLLSIKCTVLLCFRCKGRSINNG